MGGAELHRNADRHSNLRSVFVVRASRRVKKENLSPLLRSLDLPSSGIIEFVWLVCRCGGRSVGRGLSVRFPIPEGEFLTRGQMSRTKNGSCS